ncbi:low temperature requirement protein A [Lysobacter firmicutimachus]|uniref:Low temperature requirement protein A n=1 Tax=Lysobacter firmicutimachus TaxID=1792846 RepID=A0ABU8CWF8_9GAMM
MNNSSDPKSLHHHVRRMGGRDPHEAHRVATPLELLFDLTFVISFGSAASQFAHALAEGHYSTALIGFGLTSFGICWVWVNFSWFSAAYDTDDWLFRIMTMTQMIGVLIFAIGRPRLFASLESDDGRASTGMMVFGYVVMRVALVLQWLRAASQNPTETGGRVHFQRPAPETPCRRIPSRSRFAGQPGRRSLRQFCLTTGPSPVPTQAANPRAKDKLPFGLLRSMHVRPGVPKGPLHTE